MQIFHLVAFNPAVAVMTGTMVKTEAMTKIVSIAASSAREAMESGEERAKSKGYRILAASEELHVPGWLKVPVESIESAFPTDPAVAAENDFYVDEDATFTRGEQPRDFMSNRAEWDQPFQSVCVVGIEIPLYRTQKFHGGAGHGFARGAVRELYVTSFDEDQVQISVMRDRLTVAAHGRNLDEIMGSPYPEEVWFHSKGRSDAVAASALFAAIQVSRGLDPKVAPGGQGPKP